MGRIGWLLLWVVLVGLVFTGLPGCGGSGGGSGGSTGAIPSSGGGEVAVADIGLPPGPPSTIPEPLKKTLPVLPDQKAGPWAHTYNPGWQTISFPMASVTAVRGFIYPIFWWDGTSYQQIDPVANPELIVTNRGYWGYFDTVTPVYVEGAANQGEVNSVGLNVGWNLMGAPVGNALSPLNFTVSNGAETRTLEICSGITQPVSGVPWLFSKCYTYGPSNNMGLSNPSTWSISDLTTIANQQAGTPSMDPWLGSWIYAWTAVTMNYNLGTPGGGVPLPPTITQFNPGDLLFPNDTVTINGINFGTSGFLYIGGRRITPTTWGDGQITFNMPAGIPMIYGNNFNYTGLPVVVINGQNSFPSPRGVTPIYYDITTASFTVTAPSPADIPGPVQVTISLLDSYGNPLQPIGGGNTQLIVTTDAGLFYGEPQIWVTLSNGVGTTSLSGPAAVATSHLQVLFPPPGQAATHRAMATGSVVWQMPASMP